MKGKVALFLTLLFIFPISVFASGSNVSEEFQEELYSAKVLEVLEILEYESSTVQVLSIEILNGEYEGTVSHINNTLTGSEYDITLRAGDKINVATTVVDGEPSFYYYSYNKSDTLLVLLVIFIVSVILLAGLKGVKALISLGITISLIIFVMIPLLLKGYSPIILSIIVCILSTIITFVITNGFTKKTLIAIIGVCAGLVIAGALAYSSTIFSNISGVVSQNEQMLAYIPGAVDFDYKGLLFAGIIIGALGACMDVSMELTSSLYEIKTHNKKVKDKELIKSGFNIAKDIMGTMINTLILAYTGSSLSLMILFVGFEKTFTEIINLDSISVEIIRALSGSIGLLCTIPVTIFVFVLLNKKRGEKLEKVN